MKAEAESLAKQVARNTLVQRDLEIQIDAAKRTVALYSNPNAAMAAAAATLNVDEDDDDADDDDDNSSECDTPAGVTPPAIPAMVRQNSRSSSSSNSSCSKRTQPNANSSSTSSSSAAPASAATAVSTMAISAMPPTKVGTSSSSFSRNQPAVAAATSATGAVTPADNGTPRQVKSRPAHQTANLSAPAPSHPRPVNVRVGDDFPARVPSDGGTRPAAKAAGAGVGRPGGPEAGGGGRATTITTSGARVPQDARRRASASGVTAAMGSLGSFDVKKQIMFQTTR